MSHSENKYRYGKTTKHEPNHKKLSLKRHRWVCFRNGRNSHKFQEYLWPTSTCKWRANAGFPIIRTTADRFDPAIIQAWHEAESRDEATGRNGIWSLQYWRKYGFTRYWVCALCGKAETDYELKPDKRIRNNVATK